MEPQEPQALVTQRWHCSWVLSFALWGLHTFPSHCRLVWNQHISSFNLPRIFLVVLHSPTILLLFSVLWSSHSLRHSLGKEWVSLLTLSGSKRKAFLIVKFEIWMFSVSNLRLTVTLTSTSYLAHMNHVIVSKYSSINSNFLAWIRLILLFPLPQNSFPGHITFDECNELPRCWAV